MQRPSQREIVTEVSSVKDLLGVPYHKQGNFDHYTESALERRQALRTHPLVTEALHALWLAALESVDSPRSIDPFPSPFRPDEVPFPAPTVRTVPAG